MLCLASGHLRVLEKQASDHYDYSDLNFCFWLRIIGSLSVCFFFLTIEKEKPALMTKEGNLHLIS
jgi:hypothetical protein